MAKKAKTPTIKKAAAAPKPEQLRVRIAVDVPEGTPTFYANYVEVAHSKWDFAFIASRLPAKTSAAQVADMQATGTLNIPAEVVINLPSTLIAGLIRALTAQKEKFENETGTELKEREDANAKK
jgi:hypothetical protein